MEHLFILQILHKLLLYYFKILLIMLYNQHHLIHLIQTKQILYDI